MTVATADGARTAGSGEAEWDPGRGGGAGPGTVELWRERFTTRLLGVRPSDRLLGWLGPLVAAAIGGFLRFWQLGTIRTLIFDETYYVKEGYSMLLWGVEMRDNQANKDNVLWNAGVFDPPTIFLSEPDFVVHPPFGKWVIAAGEHLFGIANPLGWRFSLALLGTLSILMLGRAARRMFGSTYLGTCAALLLALDGHHFVSSRTGILDLIVMFFALAGFCALLVDRDHARARLADRAARSYVGHGAGLHGRGAIPGLGPWQGLRPWRWVGFFCLALCIATKWSGLWYLAIFGLMTVFWDLGARRAIGVERWWVGGLLKDALPAFASMLLIVPATYLATWVGWFRSDNGWYRHWAQTNPAKTSLGRLAPESIQSLWKYHQDVWEFHTHLTSSHDYMTNPWSWIVMGRPTSFYYEGPKLGEQGCTVAQCSKAITDIGTITIWWGAAVAIPILVAAWALARDWRAGAVLAGLVAGWFPWFLFQERTIYTFYAVAFVPWVVLAVTYVLGLVLGPPGAPASRRRLGVLVTGAYVVLTAALFAFWWPILSAQVIPQEQWQWHMWFPSWV